MLIPRWLGAFLEQTMKGMDIGKSLLNRHNNGQKNHALLITLPNYSYAILHN
jgi:hypothetical protein